MLIHKTKGVHGLSGWAPQYVVADAGRHYARQHPVHRSGDQDRPIHERVLARLAE